MHKILALVLLVSIYTGCQGKPREEGSSQPAEVKSTAQSHEAAKRLLQQGVQFLGEGDLEKAVVSFHGATEVDPNYIEGHLLLAQLYMRIQRYEDAVTVLERAAKNFPDNGFVFYLLSISNQQLERTFPAILSARRSVEIFQKEKDQESLERAVLLLQALVAAEQQKQ